MHIYLAGPFRRKSEIRDIAGVVKREGVEITSGWLFSKHESDSSVTVEVLAQEAMMDIKDLQRTDMFVLVNPEEWKNEGSGGKHFESGFAMARGMQLVIIGVCSSAFHRLPQWTVFPTVHGFISWLEDELKQRSGFVGELRQG